MTLNQEITISKNSTSKFEITGSLNPDGSYDGSALYKIDGYLETKYWLGPDPNSQSSQNPTMRALVSKEGEILQIGFHKGFIDSGISLTYAQDGLQIF